MPALRPTARTGLLLRSAIVVLTVATGLIHLSLGSLLFTLDGLGYLVAAVAMVAPLTIAIRFRWFIRLGLVAYALLAIVGWYLTGPRYDVAYLAKAIEVGLITLLAVEIHAYDGSPFRRLRHPVRHPAGA